MLLPAITGSGASDLVTDRSTRRMRLVIATSMLLLLLGSAVVLETVAVLVIVAPWAVLEFTLTTIMKSSVSAPATVALKKSTLRLPPTAGALVLQPPCVVIVPDTNALLARRASVTVTLCASDGPLSLKLIV